ncbi:TPA: hypothetical protein QDZ95_003030 [Shewanella algae]|nr:hypothetical protein [Shewanella algae]
MTMPPQDVIIECPVCGHEYSAMIRPSINRQLDNFDDAYVKCVTTSECPSCQAKIRSGLVVDKDGNFNL